MLKYTRYIKKTRNVNQASKISSTLNPLPSCLPLLEAPTSHDPPVRPYTARGSGLPPIKSLRSVECRSLWRAPIRGTIYNIARNASEPFLYRIYFPVFWHRREMYFDSDPIYIYWHVCLFKKRYLLVYLNSRLLQGIPINSPVFKGRCIFCYFYLQIQPLG